MSEPIENPEQLPVAFVDKIWIERPDLVMSQELDIGRLFMRTGKEIKNYIPLYTHPMRELSDEEIMIIHDATNTNNWVIDFARAIIKASQGDK